MNKNNIPRSRISVLIYGLIFTTLFFQTGYSLYSQSESSSIEEKPALSPAGTLNFTEVLLDARRSTGFLEALTAYEKSLLEREVYSHPGDAGLSITPGVKSQWTDFDSPGQTDLSLDSGISFFLGRSSLQEEKYQTAERAVSAARLEMYGALNDSNLILYELYSSLRLLQEEHTILVQENRLASDQYEGIFQLYTGGVASLEDLETSSEELQFSEDTLNQNLLKQRLTWFTLQQARGRDQSFLTADIPELQEYLFQMSDIPRPPVLTEQATSTNVEILKAGNTILSLNQTVQRLNKKDLNIVLKPSVGYGDYSFTLNYTWSSRYMNLAAGIPLAAFNSSESGDTQEKWTGTLALALSIDSGKEDELNNKVLESEIHRQEIILQEQTNKSALALRSSYQQWLQAREALTLAESSLERLNRLKDAVYLKYESGTALKSDLLKADLAVLRGQWKISAARVDIRQTYLTLAALTGNLPFEP